MLLNIKNLLISISQDILASIKSNFEQEGRPDKWKPLSMAYKKQRYKRGYTGNILRKTGQLYNSLQAQINENDKTVVVSTNKIYAALHNYGGVINRAARSSLYVQNRSTKGKTKGRFRKGGSFGKGMSFKSSSSIVPKREFMIIPEGEMEAIRNKCKNYLLQQIKSGFTM